MDALNAWIKQIILVVLFATFLELLIPSNGYKKFIRVIMGLLILLAVMRPFLYFLETRDDKLTVREVSGLNIAGNANVQSQSNEIQKERERIAFEQYRKELIKQIKVLVETVEGVSAVAVEVVLNDGRGEKGGGTIKTITIYANAEQSSERESRVKPVKSVDIPNSAGSQKTTGLVEVKRDQIKRVVTDFFHLKTAQVIICEAK